MLTMLQMYIIQGSNYQVHHNTCADKICYDYAILAEKKCSFCGTPVDANLL